MPAFERKQGLGTDRSRRETDDGAAGLARGDFRVRAVRARETRIGRGAGMGVRMAVERASLSARPAPKGGAEARLSATPG
jgi:hypothetical protein